MFHSRSHRRNLRRFTTSWQETVADWEDTINQLTLMFASLAVLLFVLWIVITVYTFVHNLFVWHPYPIV